MDDNSGEKQLYQCPTCFITSDDLGQMTEHVEACEYGDTSVSEFADPGPSTSQAGAGKEIWSGAAEQLLLDLYREHQTSFNTPFVKKKTIWSKISDTMMRKGHDMSADRCTNKWKSLYVNYKKTVDHNNRTGNDRKSCRYFDEIDAMVGKKPNVNPPFVMTTHHTQVSGGERQHITHTLAPESATSPIPCTASDAPRESLMSFLQSGISRQSPLPYSPSSAPRPIPFSQSIAPRQSPIPSSPSSASRQSPILFSQHIPSRQSPLPFPQPGSSRDSPLASEQSPNPSQTGSTNKRPRADEGEDNPSKRNTHPRRTDMQEAWLDMHRKSEAARSERHEQRQALALDLQTQQMDLIRTSHERQMDLIRTCHERQMELIRTLLRKDNAM